jgi:hypothetical protein
MFRHFTLLIATCSVLFFSIAASAGEASAQVRLTAEERATWDGSVFRIEDAKSRVSIASIKLSVSDLKPEGDNLVGEYTIEVPLLQSKNDRGKIVLPLNLSMVELGANGGVLHGQAISYQGGKTPNLIICEVLPKKGQKILLEITTDDRTLEFTSRYSIVKRKTDS